MFTVIGLAFAIIVKVSEYPMGTPSRMGPGYFPFVLGSIMAGLGGVIVVPGAVTSGGGGGTISPRPDVFGVPPFLVFWLVAQPARLGGRLFFSGAFFSRCGRE